MTKRKPAADHTQAFTTLRKALAKQYRRKIDDRDIVRLAQYQLQEQLLVTRQLAGEIVTAAEFTEIAKLTDQAREAIAPATTERLKVVLVDGADVCCKCGGPNLCEACGQKKSPKHNRRTLEEAQAAKAKAPLLAQPALSPAPAASIPSASRCRASSG